jgi:hypothetical protein
MSRVKAHRFPVKFGSQSCDGSRAQKVAAEAKYGQNGKREVNLHTGYI